MKYLLTILLVISSIILWAQDIQFTEVHQYDEFFKEAYQTYPDVPKGILEAISYTQTHIKDVNRDHIHESCVGTPHYLGVMGLIEDGKGWFNNSLETVSRLSKQSISEINANPRNQILAYAKAYHELVQSKNISSLSPRNHIEILNDLSELPNDGSKGNDFAFDTYIYSVFTYLNDPQFRNSYQIPDYQLNLQEIFGDNYSVLSSSQIKIEQENITSNGEQYSGNVLRSSMACSDTAIPVIFVAADGSNYSSRAGTVISHVTIHTMQGSYSGSISWFQNPAANVSAHYNIRASDGQITQMVCEIDKAWHVGNSNPYTVGIEHEGYVDDPTWYTENLYQAAASITADICIRNNIPKIRTYDKNGDIGVNPISDGCFKVKGHQHFANQSHTDPGPNWDWNRFYDLLNPESAVNQNTYTSCTGSFQDPGGSGSTGNDEREFYLIQPVNASSITLNFSSFNLETNFDYLYVYDGDSYQDSLLVILNGTSIPAPITSSSGSLFLEFRTDCATLSTGWDANWTCNFSSTCAAPDGLSQSNNSINEVNFSWNTVSGATDYTLRIKRNIDSNWEYYTTTNNAISVGGLATDGLYLWGVNTNCTSGSSAYNGTSFVNTGSLTSSNTTNSCSGQFTDTGSSSGNYHNYEDWTYTIAPTGASSISLNFSTFDIEANYDYMYIYDGLNTSSPLLGTYTGTTSPGSLSSTGEALTIRFTSDNWTTKSGWEANWTCISNNTPPTTTIGTIPNWVTDDFNLVFNDVDDIQVDRQFYQVNNLDGTEWSANSNNGFLTDEFNILSSDWTSYAGNWSVSAGSLNQTDEVSGNTILSADLSQDGTHEYLYHWNSNIGGTGTNKRAGLHFFCDDASATNRGNSYFIYYRIDSDLLQIYEVNANVFSLVQDIPMVFTANQNYDFKVLYNPISGKIDVFVDNELEGTWTDSTPLTSGSFVSFRSGNCTYTIDDFNVYKSRTNNETISVGNNANDDVNTQSNAGAISAKIRSIVLDANPLISLINEADFKVDYTIPSSPTNLLGSALDATTINGSWNPSTDSHSGINYYEYSIGTTAGGTDISTWNYNGVNTIFSETGLTLTDGQTYFINVQTINGAGLNSTVTTTSFVYNATCTAPSKIASITGAYIATSECTDASGWTHYWDNVNGTDHDSDDLLLLSIKKNGNNIGEIGDGTFELKVVADPTTGAGAVHIPSSVPYVTNQNGWYIMDRYWDVTPTNQPISDVDVRFYHTSQDFNDVNNEVAVGTPDNMIFYKMLGTANPDPSTGHIGITSSDIILYQNEGVDWNHSSYGISDFYAEMMVSSFSGGGGGGFCVGCGPLPVELLQFDAKKHEQDVLVEWETASEINSDYFLVEHSSDVSNEERYEVIARINAAGNSNSNIEYSFLHENPLVGINYYRLKQVDMDGRTEIFGPKAVTFKKTANISIYPVPAKEGTEINIKCDATNSGIIEWQITDITGKQLQYNKASVSSGLNVIPMNSTGLSNGVYLVNIQLNGLVQTQRIVIY